jgi:hypothetical protein
MRLNALFQAAAALSLTATIAHSATPDLQQRADDRWAAQARHTLDSQLLNSGVQPGDKRVSVEVSVGADGVLSSPLLLNTSGSPIADAQIESAIRKVAVTAPPTELSGRRVVFQLRVSPDRMASMGVPNANRP